MQTLKSYCKKQLFEDILAKKNKKNIYEGPALKKIVISIGVKEANVNSNRILNTLTTLLLITGQQPSITKARRSIANFKLREGKIIGCKITLRGQQMYNFLEKFIHIILPQLTELKLLRYKNRRPTNHLSLGVQDCSLFPELENQYDLLSTIHGMNIDLYSKESELNTKNIFFSGLKFRFNQS
tara:strand:+ start:10593 stop:11141 length:549 start_codon:yes stop_codon:yes gene_type:complete